MWMDFKLRKSRVGTEREDTDWQIGCGKRRQVGMESGHVDNFPKQCSDAFYGRGTHMFLPASCWRTCQFVLNCCTTIWRGAITAFAPPPPMRGCVAGVRS